MEKVITIFQLVLLFTRTSWISAKIRSTLLRLLTAASTLRLLPQQQQQQQQPQYRKKTPLNWSRWPSPSNLARRRRRRKHRSDSSSGSPLPTSAISVSRATKTKRSDSFSVQLSFIRTGTISTLFSTSYLTDSIPVIKKKEKERKKTLIIEFSEKHSCQQWHYSKGL